MGEPDLLYGTTEYSVISFISFRFVIIATLILLVSGKQNSSQTQSARLNFNAFSPVASAQSAVPVTITSSLKEGTLCPDDLGATFTCVIRGTELVWAVDEYVFRFLDDRTSIGELIVRNGHSASLLRRADLGSRQYELTSVLNINVTNTTNSIQISCHNGRTSTTKSVAYCPAFPGM